MVSACNCLLGSRAQIEHGLYKARVAKATDQQLTNLFAGGDSSARPSSRTALFWKLICLKVGIHVQNRQMSHNPADLLVETLLRTLAHAMRLLEADSSETRYTRADKKALS